ncbi:vanadium-dependent haloperoxidase [Kribbella sp. NPDC055071]
MTAPLSRRGLLIAGGTTTAALAIGATSSATATTTTRTVAGADVVIEWNQVLLRILRTPGAQSPTVHATRSFAILHAAIHNAVVATTRSGTPYLFAVHAAPDASPIAAAAQAAHDVLLRLYPAQAAALDQQLIADLAMVTQHRARAAGIEAGRRTAEVLIELRSHDGSSATPPPLDPGTKPGEYRPTPPGFAAAVFTHWSRVTPFLIRRADRFRPDAYPALESHRYAAAVNEVKRKGQDTSTSRSHDQSEQADFWAAPIWNYWNEIAQSAVDASGNDLSVAAQLFAQLNLTLADAVIAFYDAKYHYRIWRPITAIRLAGTDANAATVPNPGWNSRANTPADPSYPGAHSVVSQTAAILLSRHFGPHHQLTVTSEALPGVTRHFTSFQSIADEAGISRIYAGVHTRLDHYAGQALGHDLARSLGRSPL